MPGTLQFGWGARLGGLLTSGGVVSGSSERKRLALGQACASFVFAVGSTYGLSQALSQDRAGRFFAWMAFAAVLGAAAVFLFAKKVLPKFTEPRERTLVATVLTVFGAIISVGGLLGLPTLAVVIGLLGPASASLLLEERLSAISANSGRRLLGRAAGLTVLALLLWLVTEVTALPAGIRWLALIAWIAALVIVKVSLPPVLSDRESAGSGRFVVVPAIIAVVGCALFWAAGVSSTLRVVGATAMVFGLTVASIGLVSYLQGEPRVELRPWLRTAAIAGLVMVIVSSLSTQNLLPTWPAMVGAIVVIGLVVGAFFIFRGEGLIGILLLGFIVMWAIQSTTVPSESAEAQTESAPAIIAFGDSFTSGEGGDEFFPYTNTQGSDVGNRCRRSTDAYVEVLGENRQEPVRNFGCSGAETADVLGGLDGSGPSRPQGRRTSSGAHQVLEAIDGKFAIEPAAVETVLVGIGGNDVDFSTIVAACLLPVDCDRARDDLVGNAGRVRSAMATTYQTLIERFPNAEIVVVGYPRYVGETACDRALTEAEVATANALVDQLNTSVVSAAASVNAANGNDRVDVFRIDDLFDGHTLCDDEPWANFLQVRSTEGPLLARLNPVPWIFGSAHPNPEGHRAIGDALHVWLQGERSAPVAAVSDPVGQGEPFNTEAWAAEQIASTLPTVARNLGFLVAGGILLAWWIVGNWNVPGLSPVPRGRRSDGLGEHDDPEPNSVVLGYADLPVRKQPRWSRFFGHAQGIAMHQRDGAEPTIFVSVSISKMQARLKQPFPDASIIYDSRTIRDNEDSELLRAECDSMPLPETLHPGGIAILDHLLVTPCEAPRKIDGKPEPPDLPFLLFHDLDPDTSTPSPRMRHTLTPLPGDQPQDHDPNKASAAAMAHVGDDLYIAVLSQSQYVRVLRAPGRQLEDIEDVRFVDAGDDSNWACENEWSSDAMFDGIGLTVDDGELTIHLLGLQPTRGLAQYFGPRLRRYLAFVLAIGTDIIVEARLSLDPAQAPLQEGCKRTVRIKPPSITPVRPSLRWGGSVTQVTSGNSGDASSDHIVMMVERFGSERLTNDLNALQFATSLDLPDTEGTETANSPARG